MQVLQLLALAVIALFVGAQAQFLKNTIYSDSDCTQAIGEWHMSEGIIGSTCSPANCTMWEGSSQYYVTECTEAIGTSFPNDWNVVVQDEGATECADKKALVAGVPDMCIIGMVLKGPFGFRLSSCVDGVSEMTYWGASSGDCSYYVVGANVTETCSEFSFDSWTFFSGNYQLTCAGSMPVAAPVAEPMVAPMAAPSAPVATPSAAPKSSTPKASSASLAVLSGATCLIALLLV